MANFDSKHIAIVILLLILVLNVVWWKLGHAKLVLSPEEFHVQKFIDQVADHLTLASLQVFGLTVLGDLTAELAQVGKHLVNSVLSLEFKVFKVYKNAKFARLQAIMVKSTDLLFRGPLTSANKPCRITNAPSKSPLPLCLPAHAQSGPLRSSCASTLCRTKFRSLIRTVFR